MDIFAYGPYFFLALFVLLLIVEQCHRFYGSTNIPELSIFGKKIPAGLFFLNLIFFSLVFAFSTTTLHQQFSHLASSFLEGKLYFIGQSGTSWLDTALFNGHYYWPLGPLPALLLIPFVYLSNLMGAFFLQGYLQNILVMGVFFLCFQIAKKSGFLKNDALYIAFAFVFASQFIGVALFPYGWYFAHVVTVFFLFLSLSEYLGKKRYWLIGLFMGLVTLTRLTAAIGIVFFLLEILFSSLRDEWKMKIKKIGQLIIPLIIAVLLLGLYNYLRFGNFLEQGYSFQTLYGAAEIARGLGLMNIIHLPGNLYYAFLSMPLPVFRDAVSHVLQFPFLRDNPWGMSIFITSPFLIYMFFLDYKDRISKMLWGTIGLIAVSVFLYYGIGWIQFGYRYALDFMPFLFLLFFKNYREKFGGLSRGIKFLIVISALFNLYLILTAPYAPITNVPHL